VTTARSSPTPPFVSGEGAALKAVLVVRPTAAFIRQTPIAGEPAPIAERAAEQHAMLEHRLAADGVRVVAIDGQDDRPLATLAGDAAVCFPDGAFLMRPSAVARRGEPTAVEAILGREGLPILGRVVAPGLLDGGDVIVGPETVYVGVPTARAGDVGLKRGAHGNALGRAQLRAYVESIGRRYVEVRLWADVRRLRAVASLIDDETVLLAPGVLDAAAFGALERIEVPRGEEYGAGVLTLGERRVIANLRFRETLPRLRKARVVVDAIDLWEFGKIGATPSYLSLPFLRGRASR